MESSARANPYLGGRGALPRRGNDNMTIFVFLSTSQGMRINYVHVHYAYFALIIVMNLTNFNNILTSRLLNSLCISNIGLLGIFLKLFGIYSFRYI